MLLLRRQYGELTFQVELVVLGDKLEISALCVTVAFA